MNDNIELQLFSYKVKYSAYGQSLFKDCTLVQPFGPFKKDEHVAWIVLDYDQSRIVCENEAEERIYEGRLVLGVE